MSCILNISILLKLLILFTFLKLTYSKTLKKLDDCEKFYLAENCYYFPCLDAHYLCGKDSHLARFSNDLCSLTTQKYSSQLNQNGKLYFNHTNRCAMISLHNQITEEIISRKFSCTQLQIMIFNIYLTCLQNKEKENKLVNIIDFCSVVCDNLQTMIDIFLNLRSEHINLSQLLSETGKSCGANINLSIGHTIPSLLMSVCLDRKNVRLKQDITNVMFNKRFEPSDYEWV